MRAHRSQHCFVDRGRYGAAMGIIRENNDRLLSMKSDGSAPPEKYVSKIPQDDE